MTPGHGKAASNWVVSLGWDWGWVGFWADWFVAIISFRSIFLIITHLAIAWRDQPNKKCNPNLFKSLFFPGHHHSGYFPMRSHPLPASQAPRRPLAVEHRSHVSNWKRGNEEGNAWEFRMLFNKNLNFKLKSFAIWILQTRLPNTRLVCKPATSAKTALTLFGFVWRNGESY